MANEDERVAQGVKVLDHLMPGWHEKIDLAKLDLDCNENCITGQLWGHETKAPPTLRRESNMRRLGLLHEEGEGKMVALGRLKAAWRKAIAARQTPKPPPPPKPPASLFD